MPKVSVIIPTCNRSRYLCETIDSVLAQTYRDFEIIVVDDGSTDDTAEIIKRYGDNLRYIYQKNQGISEAMNTGIRNSQSEYFVVLDDDDLWLPDFLETQVAVLDQRSESAFVCSAAYVIDPEGEIDRQSVGGALRDRSFEDLLKDNFIFSSTTLIRRTCFEAVGYLDRDLKIVQDWDLWLRLAKKYRFEYSDKLIAKYRVHPRNVSKKLKIHLEDNMRVFKKPEIIKGVSFFLIQECIARSYHDFGDRYVRNNLLREAAVCYFKAALHWPIIGIYFWPPEAKRFRLSFFYRLLKPYLFSLYVVYKTVFNRRKRDDESCLRTA